MLHVSFVTVQLLKGRGRHFFPTLSEKFIRDAIGVTLVDLGEVLRETWTFCGPTKASMVTKPPLTLAAMRTLERRWLDPRLRSKALEELSVRFKQELANAKAACKA